MQDKENKLLEVEIENLRMQISEYNQIVAELTEKLQRYEKNMGLCLPVPQIEYYCVFTSPKF